MIICRSVFPDRLRRRQWRRRRVLTVPPPRAVTNRGKENGNHTSYCSGAVQRCIMYRVSNTYGRICTAYEPPTSYRRPPPAPVVPISGRILDTHAMLLSVFQTTAARAIHPVLVRSRCSKEYSRSVVRPII